MKMLKLLPVSAVNPTRMSWEYLPTVQLIPVLLTDQNYITNNKRPCCLIDS